MMKRANTTKVAPEGGASELGSALLAKAAAGLSGEALSAVHEAWEQGQPPLGETYAKPANHSVQRCLLFGGDSLVGHKSTNLTNKAGAFACIPREESFVGQS